MQIKLVDIYSYAFLALLMCGCSSEEILKENSDKNNSLPTVVFSAGFTPEAGARTTVDGAGKVRWDKDDVINVNGNPSTSTELLSDGDMALFTVEALPEYSTVYPSSAVDSYKDGVFTVNLATEQKYNNGDSFSNNENVSVAYSIDDNKFKFRNTCGLLKATLSSKIVLDDIKEVRFWSKDNPVAGQFTVTPKSGVALTPVVGKEKLSKKITFATAQSISPSSDLKIALLLPPAKYALNWRLELVNSVGTVVATRESESELNIASSKITDAGKLYFLHSANTYIVAPGQSIDIPVVRANESFLNIGGYPMDKNGRCIQLPASASWYISTLWAQDGTVTLSNATGIGPSGYFTVTAGDKPGNVVVTLQKRADEIIWSWHIWITNEDPAKNPFVFGRTFMDRNLGALSKEGASASGLYYQWGRKDPFRTSGFTIGDQIDLTYSFRHPTSYMSSLVSWLGNANLWGNTSIETVNSKSVYDPCPAGWRVPTYIGYGDPFESMRETGTWTGNGRVYGNGSTSYFPAAGSIDATGRFSNSNGYYWTAAHKDYRNSWYFYFSSSSSIPGNTYTSATGMQVRCMKDK